MDSIMDKLIEEFAGFLKSEKAQRIIRNYEKGMITYDETVQVLTQVREDIKHRYIIRCKEDRKGARWRDYSGANLSREKAEEYATELNNGEYGEHISMHGNRIIFKAFMID